MFKGKKNEKKPEYLRKKAIELYIKGNVTNKEICFLIGISKSTLGNILKDSGVKILNRKRGYPKIDIVSLEKALESYKNKNISLKEICKVHSISETTLQRYVKKYGIPPRQEEASKRLSEKEVDLLITLYENTDLTIKEICNITGTSATALYLHLRLQNKECRNKREGKLSRREIKLLVSMYKDKDYSLKDIEEKFNISGSCLRRAVLISHEPSRKDIQIKLTQNKIDIAINQYEKANTHISSVLKDLGLSSNIFYSRLKKKKPNRLKGNDKKLSTHQIQELIALYKNSRKSMDEICSIGGIGQTTFYSYLKSQKENFRRDSTGYSTKIVPTDTEIKNYYDLVWRSPKKKHTVLIKTLLYTGATISDLIDVQITQVDLENCLIKIPKKNNKEEKMVFFPVSFRETLTEHIEEIKAKKRKYLFESSLKKPYSEDSMRKVLYFFTKAAGLNHSISPRKLRHFLFTWMKKQGIEDPFLQSYLGYT